VLPYATMTRPGDYSSRKGPAEWKVWEKNTQEKRFDYEAGRVDALVAANSLEGEENKAIQALLRQGAMQVKKAWKKAEMALKLGLNAIDDKVYDRTDDLQDLDDEEAKLVKEFLKEAAKNDGGGKVKKKEATWKPYVKAEEAAAALAVPGMGFSWGTGHQFLMNLGIGGMSGMVFSAMPPTGWQGVMMVQLGMMHKGGMAMQQGPVQCGTMHFGNAQQGGSSLGGYNGGILQGSRSESTHVTIAEGWTIGNISQAT